MRAYPAHFSRLQPKVEGAVPALGEHVRAVAVEAGIAQPALDQMIRDGGLAAGARTA